MTSEKSERARKGKNALVRGKKFERDVANALKHVFPNAERWLEYQSSNALGIDIKNTGEFDIQCKRNATYAPIKKIFEIQRRDKDRIPVLITKGNGQGLPAMAVVPFDRFIRMIERMDGVGYEDPIIPEITQQEGNIPSLEVEDTNTIETTAIEVKSDWRKDQLVNYFDNVIYDVSVPFDRVRLGYRDEDGGGSAYFIVDNLIDLSKEIQKWLRENSSVYVSLAYGDNTDSENNMFEAENEDDFEYVQEAPKIEQQTYNFI